MRWNEAEPYVYFCGVVAFVTAAAIALWLNSSP